MEAIAIVTVLSLVQFVWFSIQVGSMRQKHGVKAPAMSGHPEFERMMRVQQNTMEQLVMFLPALWLYASLVNPLWGAGIGVIYLIGRFMYCSSYVKDPSSRSMGFMISVLPTSVMLIWVLVAAVMKLAG